MNTVQMAARLYECRDAARSLLGEHFKRDMALWAKAIEKVAAEKKCNDLTAAKDMARESGGFGAIVILAAWVEMVEPTDTATKEKA